MPHTLIYIKSSLTIMNSLSQCNTASSLPNYDSPELILQQICRKCKRTLFEDVAVHSMASLFCVGCFAKYFPLQNVSQGTFQGTKVKNEDKQGNVSMEYSIRKNILKEECNQLNKFDQLALLHSMETFGFGNWDQIKWNMLKYGSNYSTAQIETHYLTKMLAKEDKIEKQSFEYSSIFKNRNEQLEQIEVKPAIVSEQLTISDQSTIIGYNPKRRQFEFSYDNQAQSLISLLQFRQDDAVQESELKLKIIQQYNNRLTRRQKVHQFVLEHKLLHENNKKQEQECPQMADAAKQLRCLARFSSRAQHEDLIKKVAFSKQLQSLIEGLRRFRRVRGGSFDALDKYVLQMGQPKKKFRINSYDQENNNQVLNKFGLDKKDIKIIKEYPFKNGNKFHWKGVSICKINGKSN